MRIVTNARITSKWSQGLIMSMIMSTGVAQAAPEISIDNFVSSLSFGNVAVGNESVTQTVTVRNISSTDNLVLYSYLLSGVSPQDYVIDNSAPGSCVPYVSYAPSQSCTIGVKFKPILTGLKTALLTINNNTANSKVDITLDGTGTQVTTAPVIEIQPASLNYAGTVVDTASGPQTVTVKNLGSSDLLVNNITVSGLNAGDFSYAADTCSGRRIAQNNSCTVQVYFKPTVLGSRTASLNFAHNAANAASPVALSGTGISGSYPGITASNSTYYFPTTSVGSTSNVQTLTLNSTGTGPLKITGFSLSNNSDFVISGGTCQQNVSSSNPIVLQPNTNCTVGLAFKPQAGGARSDTFLVTSNGSVKPVEVYLSGTATVPPAPVAQLSDTGLIFNSTIIGQTSAGKAITLTNTGNAPLQISSVAVTSGITDFAISSSTCSNGSVLATGSSCVVNLVFSPNIIGTRQGALTIAHNAAGSPSVINLSGVANATPTAQVTLSTSSFAFDNTFVGASSAMKTLVISNTGSAVLNLSGGSIVGTHASDFRVVGGSCQQPLIPQLAPGSNCTIDLRFTPSASGLRSAQYQFATQLGTSNVSLSGLGSTVSTGSGTVKVSQSSLAIAALPVSSGVRTLSTRITNVGGGPLSFTRVALNGGSDVISRSSLTTCNSGTVLQTNESCDVVIDANPVRVGIYNAQIEYISSGGSGSIPVQVGVTSVSTDNGVVVPDNTFVVFPGTTKVGVASGPQLITLRNTSTQTAYINSIVTNGPFSLVSNSCPVSNPGFMLSSGMSCQLGVVFKSTTAGDSAGSVALTMRNGTVQTVELRATAVSVPVEPPAAGGYITFDVSILNFPATAVGSTSAVQTLRFNNTGSQQAVVTNVTTTGAFSILTNSCGTSFTLNVGQSCEMGIVYKPTSTNNVGTLNVALASGQTQTVLLVGTTGGTEFVSSDDDGGGCTSSTNGRDISMLFMILAAVSLLVRRHTYKV